jgi:hypothetical protein
MKKYALDLYKNNLNNLFIKARFSKLHKSDLIFEKIRRYLGYVSDRKTYSKILMKVQKSNISLIFPIKFVQLIFIMMPKESGDE